jgi:hypothetical protein
MTMAKDDYWLEDFGKTPSLPDPGEEPPVVPDFDSPVGVVIGASQVALDAAWHGRDAKSELLKNPSLTQRDIDFICKILRQAADALV